MTQPHKRKPLTLTDVSDKIIKRWKAVEYSNRRRARLKGADALPVNFPAIIIDYDAKCCICFEPIDIELSGHDQEGLTLEHMIALGQGGHHVTSNIGPAHRRCNEAKNNQEDTPKAAKVTRTRNKFEDFFARMNGDTPPVRRKKKQIAQRPVSQLSKDSPSYRKPKWRNTK